jgi:hypothetical protein
VGLYIVKGVDCRFERSRLDRRRAKSVAMRRYIEAAAWKVKERVDEEGSTRERREIQNSVSCRGQDDVNTRKPAQKRSGIVKARRRQYDVLIRLVKSTKAKERRAIHMWIRQTFSVAVFVQCLFCSHSNNHQSPLQLPSLSPNHAPLLQA